MDAERGERERRRRERALILSAIFLYSAAGAAGVSFAALNLGALLGFILGWIDRGRT